MNEMMDMVAAFVMAAAKSFDIQVSEFEVKQELKIWKYNERSQNVRKRYENLVEFLNEPIFLNVFHLALAQYFYPPMYNILREYTGQGVTLHLAMLFEDEINLSVKEMKENFEKLKQVLKTEKEIENFLYSEFYADERLVMYLMGSDDMSPMLQNICNISMQDSECEEQEGMEFEKISEGYLHTGLEALMKGAVSDGTEMIIQLCTENISSGIGVIKNIYNKTESPFFLIDLIRLIKNSKEQEHIYIKEIIREVLFYKCYICLVVNNKNVEINQNIDEYFENWIWSYKSLNNKPICVITDSFTEITPRYNIPIFKYYINANYINDNVNTWEKTACKFNAVLCDNTEFECRKKGLQRIKSSFTFQDIKISQKEKNKLLQLISYIKYSSQVFDKWNMKDKYPYGRNMTVLFSGPPGTGKTMAAGALAKELNMPLYKADLSTIMDKYIGETEKRLEGIFSECERKNVILFFDEADVLFGKRSEIKDSKDKFANSSVSYILQRIEQYEGMIILATNLKNNMDAAFLRRIKYIISFHMPDSKARTEIWKSGFTKEIPTEAIDMEFLGEKVELSGGYIKNIILNAAFNAADEDSPVTMKHILQSVENEYDKLGMIIPAEAFERYSEYFTGQFSRESEETINGIIYSNKYYQ